MGVFDIHCVVCGITATGIHWYENDLEDLKEILDIGKFNIPSNSKYKLRLGKKEKEIDPKLIENYKKFIKDVNKLKPKFKWTDKLCLVTDKKVVNVDLKNQSDGGSFEKGNKYYETMKFNWNYSERALVCHRSCYKLLSDKLKYKLNISDIEGKLNDMSMLKSYGNIVDKYTNHQEFPWTWMILNEDPFNRFERLLNENRKLKVSSNVDFLMDPLKNKKNETRILNVWKKLAKKSSKKVEKKDRPSPSESATLFKVGTKKKGNDGNMYEVVVNKNNVKRWKKITKKK